MKIDKIIKVLAFSLIFAGTSAHAAKVQPADCPCNDAIVELSAEASCTDQVNFTREGRGRNGKTKNLLWVEDGVCTRFNVSQPGSDVDVFQGAPSGPNCDYEGGQRCTMDLSASQLRACEVVLRTVKREIQKLPDCQ